MTTEWASVFGIFNHKRRKRWHALFRHSGLLLRHTAQDIYKQSFPSYLDRSYILWFFPEQYTDNLIILLQKRKVKDETFEERISRWRQNTFEFTSFPTLAWFKHQPQCVLMGSESIAHSGSRNNCFSKIQRVGQKYRDKATLASRTRFSRHCFGFLRRRFSQLARYNI